MRARYIIEHSEKYWTGKEWSKKRVEAKRYRSTADAWKEVDRMDPDDKWSEEATVETA